ncbi:hypothetical protein D4764_18G0005060 [Takifugu flavidus]|uniref:Uncharacterized protein n=1 Tax=Takifugu flavidus TaxID=433684 RepID=A0A5C6NUD2_9TELE|nr:hypothetical protein D4764_18G0005060 [Takifugu flavidus]
MTQNPCITQKQSPLLHQNCTEENSRILCCQAADLQVFLLQAETDPVFHSKHLKDNRNTPNNQVKPILDLSTEVTAALMFSP